MKYVMTNATSGDVAQSLEVVWEALQAVREELIPEGDDAYDAEWDEICTAMAWIEDALGENADD